MRLVVMLALVVVPAGAFAQSRTPVPAPGTQSDDAAPITAPDASPDQEAAPLAAGRKSEGARILSKNEAYNQARAAEGRVGVRLGNDMSFRVTGN